jgi:hypothetical protein
VAVEVAVEVEVEVTVEVAVAATDTGSLRTTSTVETDGVVEDCI